VAIGDDALFFAGRAEWRVDLGAAWTDWTGLPFVFAVWAGPRGDDPALASAFESCYRENAARLEELASRAAGQDAGRRERLISYLRNCVRYRLGVEEGEGLARFLTLGADAGYLPHISEGTPHVHVA
jgi:chorismate dehydratase